nr:TetR/AcrR family transcriptional regulator [Paenibacillus sp. NEAU-GSW1]
MSAASSIVNTLGAEKLTLEAVAKQAGMSKGGLLHHFPNKQALVHAMMEHSTVSFISNVTDKVSYATGEGKWTLAYIEATFADAANDCGKEINAAIISSLFSSPDVLGKLQSEYAELQKHIENDGIDPVLATIIRLAADGLWFSEMVGVGELDGDLRHKVIEYLIQMAKNEK